MYPVQFDPPLPNDCQDNTYIDTSILRVLCTQLNDELGKSIMQEIAKLTGKRTTSHYVIYEIKRSYLDPIWNLYMLTYEKQDYIGAISLYNQSFSNRLPKTLVSILTQMMSNSVPGIPQSGERFCSRLFAVADEI